MRVFKSWPGRFGQSSAVSRWPRESCCSFGLGGDADGDGSATEKGSWRGTSSGSGEQGADPKASVQITLVSNIPRDGGQVPFGVTVAYDEPSDEGHFLEAPDPR